MRETGVAVAEAWRSRKQCQPSKEERHSDPWRAENPMGWVSGQLAWCDQVAATGITGAVLPPMLGEVPPTRTGRGRVPLRTRRVGRIRFRAGSRSARRRYALSTWKRPGRFKELSASV